MKREISPAVMGVVITVMVLVIGVFFYRKVVVNQPSIHPQYGSSGAANASTNVPMGASGQGAGNGNAPATNGAH